MMATGISQRCQRRYPRFYDDWLQDKVMRYALAYLVCLQIMVNNVYIARCQQLIACGINLYIQKEQLTLLDEEGHPSLFATIMIATLSTCAQLERDNISFRLQSGRKRYMEKGGKLGRKVGSVKTEEQMKAEYREVISLLRKGFSIRDVAKLCGKGVSTVQRVKRLLKVQSQ